jgi:branched-subunit amino acid aminotransferase/4-amino-4-deoxychorismate lyase
MSESRDIRAEIDGLAARTDELLVPLVNNYGHFTAMQVRDFRTRGIDFHVARLDSATRELFGVGLDGDRVRGYIRHALGEHTPDASVRVNVFSPGPDEAGLPEVRVLVLVRPPAQMGNGPWSLASVPYQRPFAHIKHVGGFAQGRYIDLVEEAGFDEALLVGDDGVVAEGAITNLGFVSGDSVLWPDAPMLLGIGMQVLERELAQAGVPSLRRRVTLADVGSFDGVFVTNSRGFAVVRRIDERELPVDAPLLGQVQKLFAGAPWDVI